MRWILFVIALTISTPALALESQARHWEFGPYLGLGVPDDYGAADLRTGPIAGARFGYFFTDNFSSELSVQRLFTRDALKANVGLNAFRLNLLWNFLSGRKLRPFFTLGAGLEWASLSAGVDEKKFGLVSGAGLRWFFSDHAGLRADIRLVTVDVGQLGRQENMEFAGGLFFLFGCKKDEKPIPTAAPAPAVTPTPESTPAPAEVKDLDGDGVPDTLDKCPGTPAGEKVDETGCPPKAAKARGVLKGVAFKTSSAELTDSAKRVLDEVAQTLNEFPAVKAEVQGHTDNMGDVGFNQTLSQRRAETVAAYLESKGVAKERLVAKGYGATAPIADNKMREGRNTNRRVELKWLDQ